MAVNIKLSVQPKIPFEKVLSRLGYLSGKTRIDKTLEEAIATEIALAKKLLSPKYVLADSYVQLSEPDETRLEPGLKIKSKDIHNILRGCVKAFGFALTIGPYLEEKRNLFIKEKQTTKALILDAAGSVAAEEFAESINKAFETEAAKENLALTRRFSPGYGDWDISGQKDFLLWLGAQKIGIELNEKFQMNPEKSVSAIIGAKRNE